jgi:hypothetical protein
MLDELTQSICLFVDAGMLLTLQMNSNHQLQVYEALRVEIEPKLQSGHQRVEWMSFTFREGMRAEVLDLNCFPSRSSSFSLRLHTEILITQSLALCWRHVTAPICKDIRTSNLLFSRSHLCFFSVTDGYE